MKAAEEAIARSPSASGASTSSSPTPASPIDGLLLRVKEEDLDRIFAVNVKGALACARAADEGR